MICECRTHTGPEGPAGVAKHQVWDYTAVREERKEEMMVRHTHIIGGTAVVEICM